MAISGSLTTLFAPRLPLLLPKSDDPALQTWVKLASAAVNALPPMSTFSFTTPNSNVSAQRGTIGVNFNSNASVCWVKTIGSGNTGWTAIA